MSVAILDDILAENVHNIDESDLSEDEIRHIKAMITAGKGGSPAPPGKRWLYEVLSSPLSCGCSAQCLMQGACKHAAHMHACKAHSLLAARHVQHPMRTSVNLY